VEIFGSSRTDSRQSLLRLVDTQEIAARTLAQSAYATLSPTSTHTAPTQAPTIPTTPIPPLTTSAVPTTVSLVAKILSSVSHFFDAGARQISSSTSASTEDTSTKPQPTQPTIPTCQISSAPHFLADMPRSTAAISFSLLCNASQPDQYVTTSAFLQFAKDQLDALSVCKTSRLSSCSAIFKGFPYHDVPTYLKFCARQHQRLQAALATNGTFGPGEFQFMAYTPLEGQGNRMRAMVSTFVLAMLSKKIFMVDWYRPHSWELIMDANALTYEWDLRKGVMLPIERARRAFKHRAICLDPFWRPCIADNRKWMIHFETWKVCAYSCSILFCHWNDTASLLTFCVFHFVSHPSPGFRATRGHAGQ
jgi:hypothetical protein